MRPNVLYTLLTPLVLAATLACSEKSEPPAQAPLTLEDIAAAWSGGRTDAACRPHGPRGEYLVPGDEHCQWPTVSRGAQWSTVSGSRGSVLGLSSLTWERTVPDVAAALQLADSLGAALTERGLTAYATFRGQYARKVLNPLHRTSVVAVDAADSEILRVQDLTPGVVERLVGPSPADWILVRDGEIVGRLVRLPKPVRKDVGPIRRALMKLAGSDHGVVSVDEQPVLDAPVALALVAIHEELTEPS